MSKYTTEIRFICETLNGDTESSGYNSINSILTNTHSQIFDFEYPIFDESYRPVLEKKILKHFYTREIGYEVYGRWKLALDAKMNEIMPYYNQLYKSELIEFNPLYDFEENTTSKRTHDDEINETIDSTRKDTGTVQNDKTGNDTIKFTGTDTIQKTGTVTDDGDMTTRDGGTETTSNANKNDHWDYYSDTPQGEVGNLRDLSYLTNARHITDDGTGSTSNTTFGKTVTGTDDNTRTYNTTDTRTPNTSEKTEYDSTNTQTLNTQRKDDSTRVHEYDSIVDYIENVQGKSRGKSYSKMLNEFRTTFLNIDMRIINDLEELFMQIW